MFDTEGAISDFNRLCSFNGTIINDSSTPPSLSREQFIDVLNQCDCLLRRTRQTCSEELFDRLLSMCREAESIATSAEKNNKRFLSSSSSSFKFSTSIALKDGKLDSDALRCLYSFHPSYTTCQKPMDTSLALADYMKKIFEDHIEPSEKDASTESFSDSEKSSKKISRSETTRLLEHLSDHSLNIESAIPGSESESEPLCSRGTEKLPIDSIVDQMILSHHSTRFFLDDFPPELSSEIEKEEDEIGVKEMKLDLDLEMIASSLLQYHDSANTTFSLINHKSLFYGNLPEKIFNPFHTNPNDFISILDKAVLHHDALNHHVLNALSMGLWGGGFGSSSTIGQVVKFMDAYRYFTSTFCHHLERTIMLVSEADPTGHHVEVLEENLEEEQGIYDDEAINMIQGLGLDVEKIRGITHKDLYVECCEGLRQLIVETGDDSDDFKNNFFGLSEEQCSYISNPLVSAFEVACNPNKGATAATAISAMYLGSELIVATIYSKISSYLTALAKNSEKESVLTKQHLAFFLLHIDMDVDHSNKMREIAVTLATDEATRLHMASAVDTILQARVDFFDRFFQESIMPKRDKYEEERKGFELFHEQSQNWLHKDLRSIYDVSRYPDIFQICQSMIPGAHVLNIGCGDGYSSRKLAGMGAKNVLGLDASKELIKRAETNLSKSDCETYEVCSNEEIMKKLTSKPVSLGIIPGRLWNEGCFDLAIAEFIFNDASISKIKIICEQIYQTLKPGGRFFFSVPHPYKFPFHDGKGTKVNMIFTTISDYTETMNNIGFDIVKIHECSVQSESRNYYFNFPSSLLDLRLHIVFDVMKSEAIAKISRVPRATIWSCFEKINPDGILSVKIPDIAFTELVDFVNLKYKNGAKVETFSPTSDDAMRLCNVAVFAKNLRFRLSNQVGAAYVTGMDLNRFGINRKEADSTNKAKFAYYIISSLIGKVDDDARGRLFDVVDKGLDTNVDNVLFSVSHACAPYHTDGASADKAYDAVGLLCINPAPEGGTLHLSNAAAALGSLKKKLPKFILNELFRPLPRDILENGKGQGVNNADLIRFSRSPDLLKLRIQHNAYPIFEEGKDYHHDLVRCRYMRQWIETGHIKSQMKLPPFLEIALNALDSALDMEKVASIKMQSGDMVFTNNMSFVHARDAFINKDGYPERHKVRVWIKLQGYE